MNGIQIEHLLSLIDGNIQTSMQWVRPDIVDYLSKHSDDLAQEIAHNGYGVIPTRAGEVKVSREDLKAA
jgi:hypothetical protein